MGVKQCGLLTVLIVITNIELIGKVKGSVINKRNILDSYTHYETVTPRLYHRGTRIYNTLYNGTYYHDIQLVINTPHHNFTLEFSKNKYLHSPDFIVKYYNEKDEEVVYKPQKETNTHCHYHVRLKHGEDENGAISTCQGVSGYFTHGGETYHIYPTESSLYSPHYLLRESHAVSSHLRCGHTLEDNINTIRLQSDISKHVRLKRSVRWPYDSNHKTKIVEMYVACDNEEYRSHNSDIKQLVQRIQEIISIASSFYRPIDTYIALVGVEIWTNRDKIDVVEDADTTMDAFIEYRKNEISPKHKNDNAQLITGKTFAQGVAGKAPIGTICTWRFSGGVNMDHSASSSHVATTVAHELGHNFGLKHDTEDCDCEDERCIMAPSTAKDNPKKWSSCSMDSFQEMFYQGLDYCLHDLPEELYSSATCGNGFVEEGEECDCGLPGDCATKCCNPATCRLAANATCSSGECCNHDTCKYKSATTTCREDTGPCDLSEYCDGKSEWCPHDVFRMDGTQCEHDGIEAYCSAGQCLTHQSGCEFLWGTTAEPSDKYCYTYFNVLGEARGHCGADQIQGTFEACQPEDVMCGLLQCEHLNEKLMFWLDTLAYSIQENWVYENVGGKAEKRICHTAVLDVGLNNRDPGLVPNGAKCGDGKMCYNQKCTPVSNLSIPHCPDCHGNGVCNSIGQCHCNVGWAPPLCNRVGDGGSLHSGPVSLHSTRSLIIGLCIFFLVILPIMIVIVVCMVRHRNQVEKFFNQTPIGRKYQKNKKPQNNAEAVSTQNTVTNHRSAPRKPRPPSVAEASVKYKPTNPVKRIDSITLKDTTNKNLAQMQDLPRRNRSNTLSEVQLVENPRLSMYNANNVANGNTPYGGGTAAASNVPSYNPGASYLSGEANQPHSYLTDNTPPLISRAPPGRPNNSPKVHRAAPETRKPARPPPPTNIPTHTHDDVREFQPPNSYLNVPPGASVAKQSYQNIPQNSEAYPKNEFSDVSLNSPTADEHLYTNVGNIVPHRSAPVPPKAKVSDSKPGDLYVNCERPQPPHLKKVAVGRTASEPKKPPTDNISPPRLKPVAKTDSFSKPVAKTDSFSKPPLGKTDSGGLKPSGSAGKLANRIAQFESNSNSSLEKSPSIAKVKPNIGRKPSQEAGPRPNLKPKPSFQ